MFRRADVLWLVFDTDDEIKLAELANDPSHNIKNATVTRLQDASVVRITLDRPKLTSVAMEGATWVVNIGSQIISPTQALSVIRNGSKPSQATATVLIADPHQVHRLADPEAGDNLWVVTALAPPRGFINGQEFVEFRMLASAQGVVVQPLADDLGVALAPDRVTLSRPERAHAVEPQPAIRSGIHG